MLMYVVHVVSDPIGQVVDGRYQIEAVIVATLERTPKDATHWSRASMAAESGLSLASVVPVLSSLAAGDWP